MRGVEAGWRTLPPDESREKRHRRAWRLAKGSWRLARRDPALAPLALLLAGSVALVTVALADAATHAHVSNPVSFLLLFVVAAVFVATFLIAFFSAAMAHAASAAIDGFPLTVREALAEARDAVGSLLVWALIATGVALLGGLVSATGALGRLTGDLALFLWGFFVAFVIPLIALDAAGAGEAVRESAAIARRRWGEELVGGFAIGLLFVLAATACLLVYVPGLHAFRDRHGAGSVLAMIAGGLALILVLLYGLATAQAFVVALLRFDEGDSGLTELEHPPEPPHPRPAALRVGGLALCAVVVVGLVALIASGIPEPKERYYTSVPTASAYGLEAGAPVVYDEQRVGDVLATAPEGSVTQVSFELEKSVVSEAYGEPVRIDTFEGQPCLTIGPAPPLGSPQPGAA